MSLSLESLRFLCLAFFLFKLFDLPLPLPRPLGLPLPLNFPFFTKGVVALADTHHEP